MPRTKTVISDHGNRPMVFLLDNHFAALLDFRQDRPYIAGKLGFCDTDGHHLFDHRPLSGSFARTSTLAGTSGSSIHHAYR
jgi:hypothetical protein